MEVRHTEHVAVPIEVVWAEITRFEPFEDGLRKRGVTLTRLSDGDPGPGTGWRAEFVLAGRATTATSEIVRMETLRALRLEGTGSGIDGFAEALLSEPQRGMTRVELVIGLQAKSIGARVVLQPLRLAQGKLRRRLKEQLARIARGMEDRFELAERGEAPWD